MVLHRFLLQVLFVVFEEPEMYVLDTNVLSQFALKRPCPQVTAWLHEMHSGLAIPFGAVIEIERGIWDISVRDPTKASELSRWLQSLLESDIPFLGMDSAVARLFAQMTAVPALNNLWVPTLTKKRFRMGQDLSIAATAIVHSIPIASMNVRDFLYIHRFFRLPGLLDPQQGRWLIPPPHGDRRQPTAAPR